MPQKGRPQRLREDQTFFQGHTEHAYIEAVHSNLQRLGLDGPSVMAALILSPDRGHVILEMFLGKGRPQIPLGRLPVCPPTG